ncbi:uncharacterized protein LOC126304678 [Schistocerca gregaria]|uniref:uncharacterized protein LOC126304678 n=1 Tax=Schistocerca gregaria TaxID=7010 RepID=UPI00211F1281|nr:uncharacterized protein LOC126304678 [Schistocerca gregaria]
MEYIEEALDLVVENQCFVHQTFRVINDLLVEYEKCEEMLRFKMSGCPDGEYADEKVIDHETARTIEQIHEGLLNLEVEKRFTNGQVQFHIAINKLSRCIDKMMNIGMDNLLASVELSEKVINDLIIHHLLRQGRLELAQELHIATHNEKMSEEKFALFRTMKYLLDQLKERNIGPLIEWVNSLDENVLDKKTVDCLVFNLHKMHFISLLRQKRPNEALSYAREKLTYYSRIFKLEIQQLMGSIPYIYTLESSPYSHFLEDDQKEMQSLFLKSYFRSVSLPAKSQLHICIQAGLHVLPKLLKAEMLNLSGSWQNLQKLNFELSLPKEFTFHSIFCCPISKGISSVSNPPNLLPCGHVLSRESVIGLKTARQRSVNEHVPKLRCPYCPERAKLSDIREITFE